MLFLKIENMLLSSLKFSLTHCSVLARQAKKNIFMVIIMNSGFRYMKFIYLHCGEETKLRDPRS